MPKRDNIRRKYGRRLAPGLGIVVVANGEKDFSYSVPVNVFKLEGNGRSINSQCSGAAVANEGSNIYVVFQVDWDVKMEEYKGSPIFPNPLYSGTKVGC